MTFELYASVQGPVQQLPVQPTCLMSCPPSHPLCWTMRRCNAVMVRCCALRWQVIVPLLQHPTFLSHVIFMESPALVKVTAGRCTILKFVPLPCRHCAKQLMIMVQSL